MPWSLKARNGAVDGATPMIMKLIPEDLREFVTEAIVLKITDAALDGAAEADPVVAAAIAPKPAVTAAQKS